MPYTRKAFVRLMGGISAGMLAGPVALAGVKPRFVKPPPRLTLGLASYTLREYSLDQVLQIATRLQLRQLCFKSMHLPLESSEQEINATVARVKQAGKVLYGAGVVYMKSAAEVENAFRYAKAAGMRIIVGVPNHDLLDLVEKKVKETDIKLAIHNHGPGDDVYPTPEIVYDRVKSLDKRLGLCMDIGHVTRLGLDPVENIKKYSDRLYDLHLKDVDKAQAEGASIEFGRGVIDLAGVMKALVEVDYAGVMAIEYEKDGKDAVPGLAESVGYARGLMAAM